MKLKTIQEANAALQPYVPLVGALPGDQMVLDRVWPLMKLLSNPQDKLRVVHIAGTSGKTSTAYYMAALLTAAGQTTGLTVSPHVDSVTERVQINGKPLSDSEFCGALGEFLDIVRAAEQQPTYFELLYAFALWVFARQSVDYAVVETGMGGLYDATNVARRPDKLCIITDIGLDHTHILGTDLAAIAAQKAGIIHDGNHVLMYEQAPEVMAVVRRQTDKLHIVPEQASQEGNMPAYQQRNWQLAKAAYDYLVERDNLPSLSESALAKTRQTAVPARLEVRRLGSKTLVMDGAHNEQKMAAFLDSFEQLYPEAKPAVLLALKEGKEYENLVPLLSPLAGRIITTAFNTTQDLPVSSMDPAVIAKAFTAAGVPAESIPDQAEAVKRLLASPEEVLVITGSFYLLSQLRNNGYLAA